MPSLTLSLLRNLVPFKPCSGRFTASDVQPAANVPRCDGSAAGAAPWAPQQPEEQHGGPDAEYDGGAAGTAPRPSQQPEERDGEPDARPDGAVHSASFVPGRQRLLFDEGLLGTDPQLCRPCGTCPVLSMSDRAKDRDVFTWRIQCMLASLGRARPRLNLRGTCLSAAGPFAIVFAEKLEGPPLLGQDSSGMQ